MLARWGPSWRTGRRWRLDNGAARSHVRMMNAYSVGSPQKVARVKGEPENYQTKPNRAPGGRVRQGAGCCGPPPGTIPCTPSPSRLERSVHYISTRDGRSRPERLSFDDMLLAGLARDGGLYVPVEWPHFDPDQFPAPSGRSYAEIALPVIAPFIGEALDAAALRRLVDSGHARFGPAAGWRRAAR